MKTAFRFSFSFFFSFSQFQFSDRLLAQNRRRKRRSALAVESRTALDRRRLRLETLEERRLLAVVWTVVSATDTFGAVADASTRTGELRACVAAAASGDEIVFDATVFAADTTIPLRTTLDVGKSLTIDASANRDAGVEISLDASAFSNNVVDVYYAYSSIDVAIKGLTLTGARATSNSTNSGGAIDHRSGNLTLENCTITGNTISSSNVSYPARGGGISSTGASCVVRNCEISNNVATTSYNNTACGGGIYANGANLTIENTLVSGNRVQTTYSGPASSSNPILAGGGVYYECLTRTSAQSLTITNSSIVGNAVESAKAPVAGGGMFLNLDQSSISGGTPNVRVVVGDSTIANNSASTTAYAAATGGGIQYEATEGSSMTIFNSTISANQLTSSYTTNGWALYAASLSNHISTIDVLNSVLTGTITTSPQLAGKYDVARPTYANIRLYYCVYGALSYESSSSGSGSSLARVECVPNRTSEDVFAGWNATTSSVDLLSDSTAEIARDSAATTAGTLVGTLDDEFYYYRRSEGSWQKVGETTTSEYLFDANAENFGLTATGSTSTVDTTAQNGGAVRVAADDGYYVGAYSRPAEASTVATTTADSDDPNDGFVSLREAIRYAASGETISFAIPANSPTLTLAAPLVVDKNLTIDGTNAADGYSGTITLDGGATSDAPTTGVRLVDVETGTTATLRNLTLQNAYSATSGGAIRNKGTLAVADVAFANNASAGNGGAIANLNGALTITGATTQTTAFSQNVGRNGGAIYSFGDAATVSIVGTSSRSVSFEGNDATGAGGAIAIRSGSLTADYVALVGNSSNKNATEYVAGSGPGGALYNAGTATVSNATFSANEAIFADGGAISNAGTGTLTLFEVVVGGSSSAKNVAVFGGGVVNSGSLIFSGGSTAISYNEASRNGGGLAVSLEENATVGGSVAAVESATVSVSNNVAAKYGGGAICVAGTSVSVESESSIAFADNAATERSESGDVSLYRVAAWPTSGIVATNLHDYSPATTSFVVQSDCAAVLASAPAASDSSDESIVYRYSFEVDGETRTLSTPTVLSPSQLGLAPGVYEGTVEPTDASGASLGFGAAPITIDVRATEPTFQIAAETLANGTVLRLKISAETTVGAVSERRLDWGDGTSTTIDLWSTSFVAARRYAEPGEYAVSLTAAGTTFELGTFVVAETAKISNLANDSEPVEKSNVANAANDDALSFRFRRRSQRRRFRKKRRRTRRRRRRENRLDVSPPVRKRSPNERRSRRAESKRRRSAT